MNLEAKMFSSQQNNDFWDRPIVFSPKRIVRVLTICVLIALSLFTVLWIAPGGRSSKSLAPLLDEATNPTLQGSNKDMQYPSSESTHLKDAAYFSSKASALGGYSHSSGNSELKGEPDPKENPFSKEKLKPSNESASTTGSGITAKFTTTPYPPLPPGDDGEYMSICIAVKNQHLDLLEWFPHYYFHHGIRRFMLWMMEVNHQFLSSLITASPTQRSPLPIYLAPRSTNGPSQCTTIFTATCALKTMASATHGWLS